jgi:hypothetical protein
METSKIVFTNSDYFNTPIMLPASREQMREALGFVFVRTVFWCRRNGVYLRTTYSIEEVEDLQKYVNCLWRWRRYDDGKLPLTRRVDDALQRFSYQWFSGQCRWRSKAWDQLRSGITQSIRNDITKILTNCNEDKDVFDMQLVLWHCLNAGLRCDEDGHFFDDDGYALPNRVNNSSKAISKHIASSLEKYGCTGVLPFGTDQRVRRRQQSLEALWTVLRVLTLMANLRREDANDKEKTNTPLWEVRLAD